MALVNVLSADTELFIGLRCPKKKKRKKKKLKPSRAGKNEKNRTGSGTINSPATSPARLRKRLNAHALHKRIAQHDTFAEKRVCVRLKHVKEPPRSRCKPKKPK